MNQKLVLGIILVCMYAAPLKSYCQESKFHAVFLTKFAETVRWPSTPNQYTIGVVGNSQVFDHLQSFVELNQSINPIKITSTSQLNQCHMVFFSASSESSISSYAQAIGNNPILVVSETDRVVGKGSDIGFYLEDGKLRFLVNMQTLESKKLVMGSNLLGRGKIQ